MDKAFNNKLRNIIGNKLLEIAPKLTCPICRQETFSVPIGYTPTRINIFAPDESKEQPVSIPTVYLVCSNCGHMSAFAAKVLISDWDSLFSSSKPAQS